MTLRLKRKKLKPVSRLDVLPRIMDHGRLMMLFSLNLSDLLDLENVNLDSSEESGYIQNPIIEERGFSQEVALKSGETLVLFRL